MLIYLHIVYDCFHIAAELNTFTQNLKYKVSGHVQEVLLTPHLWPPS